MRLHDLYHEEYLPTSPHITSDSTRKHYRVMFTNLFAACGHHPTLDDLTDETATRFIAWLSKSGLAPATVSQRIHYLLAFWRWCARKKYTDVWPTVKPPPIPKNNPTAWHLDDVSKILAACDRFPGEYDGVKCSAWWRAAHLWWWDTGERTGATLKLEWTMLRLDEAMADVPADVRKGKCIGMIYQLKPVTVDALEAIREPVRRLVFHWPKCEGMFWYDYRRLLRLGGLPHRRGGPQKLRRTFASYLERNGEDATIALGHSRRSVTVYHYLDAKIVGQRQPNRVLPDLSGD